jgi:hypothetical protein
LRTINPDEFEIEIATNCIKRNSQTYFNTITEALDFQKKCVKTLHSIAFLMKILRAFYRRSTGSDVKPNYFQSGCWIAGRRNQFFFVATLERNAMHGLKFFFKHFCCLPLGRGLHSHD